jgi:hypothetical protein
MFDLLARRCSSIQRLGSAMHVDPGGKAPRRRRPRPTGVSRRRRRGPVPRLPIPRDDRDPGESRWARHEFPGGPGLPDRGPSTARAARAGPSRPRSPAGGPQPTSLGEGRRIPRPDARGRGADRPAEGEDRAVRVAESSGGPPNRDFSPQRTQRARRKPRSSHRKEYSWIDRYESVGRVSFQPLGLSIFLAGLASFAVSPGRVAPPTIPGTWQRKWCPHDGTEVCPSGLVSASAGPPTSAASPPGRSSIQSICGIRPGAHP